MVKVGNVVEIAGRKVGDTPREGTVMGVSGSLLRIRWASGEESSLIPGPGTMTVIGSKRTAKKGATKKSTAKKMAPKKSSGAAKRSSGAAKKSTTRKTAIQKKPTAKPKKSVTKKTAMKKRRR